MNPLTLKRLTKTKKNKRKPIKTFVFFCFLGFSFVFVRVLITILHFDTATWYAFSRLPSVLNTG